MLFYGTNIQQIGTQLCAINEKELLEKIENPNSQLAAQVLQLRRILTLDTDLYRKRKTALPYFLGAEFREGIRKAENFVGIQYLVLDVDKCLQQQEDVKAFKEKIFADDSVCMLYVSPSGNGIKLLFRLKMPLQNSKVYSDYYKHFAYHFAQKHGLEKYMDFVTSDVSRVSFLSHDSEVLYRENPCPLDWQPFFTNHIFEGLADDLGQEDSAEEKPNALPKQTYKDILQTLNPKNIKPEKQAYVPTELSEIETDIRAALLDTDILVKEVKDIQYGKKIIFQEGHLLAEINVFFGKNGFSVVKSPKTGTHPDLCEAVYRIVSALLLMGKA